MGLVPRAALSTAEANKRAGLKESILIQAVQGARKPVQRPNPYLERGPPTTRSHRPRPLRFVEQGTHVAQAELMRAAAEMERLRREVAEALGQVGIDTEIVADLLEQHEPVPEYEWWDLPFVRGPSYEEPTFDYSLVTNLIQRPALLPPPMDVNAQVALKPLMLTKTERKKLRRQRRLAAHKERQEQINLGLLPPEPQKVRIANIARVLGTQSVQEPSKVEAEIRAQAQARHEAHLLANAARSVEAREQRLRDREMGREEALAVQTAVFRVADLRAPQWRFKVIKNAQQLELTGCALLFDRRPGEDVGPAAFSLVIVEGSLTAIRRYKRLMLERIKWNEPPAPSTAAIPENQCCLVWEGSTAQRSFAAGFKVFPVDNQIDAREFLASKGLESLWKLAKDL